MAGNGPTGSSLVQIAPAHATMGDPHEDLVFSKFIDGNGGRDKEASSLPSSNWTTQPIGATGTRLRRARKTVRGQSSKLIFGGLPSTSADPGTAVARS